MATPVPVPVNINSITHVTPPYKLSRNTDEILYSTGKNINETPKNISYFIINFFFGSQLNHPENYWTWKNGMRSYILLLIMLVLFGIAIFIFKLIAFTSILTHKGLEKNDPLVNYLMKKTQGFETAADSTEKSVWETIQSTYLGIISPFQSLPKYYKKADKEIKRLKYGFDQDVFQPLLLKIVSPMIDRP